MNGTSLDNITDQSFAEARGVDLFPGFEMKGKVSAEIDEIEQIGIFYIDLRGEKGESPEFVEFLLDLGISVSSDEVGGTHVFGVKYYLPGKDERRYFRVTGTGYGPKS